MSGTSSDRSVSIEFLYLDMTVCDRCTETGKNLRTAIDAVRPALSRAGVDLRLHTLHIASEAEARRHRLVSSPTIRIDGEDIAAELIETDCASCGELCNCAGGVECRVWRWNGTDYTAAPVGMIVDAILRSALRPASGAQASRPAGTYETPENLRRFFAGMESTRAASVAQCCTPAEQETCCAPSDKAVCCTTDAVATCACV